MLKTISLKKASALLRAGRVGVIPTDTIFGLSASAEHPAAVERLFRLRRPSEVDHHGPVSQKPFIILIGRQRDLKKFSVVISPAARALMRRHWPGPVSLVLPLTSAGRRRWRHLHRGAGTLAFRLPARRYLRRCLCLSGPVVAPSANPAGKQPATTLARAYNYFGQAVDFYAGREKTSLVGPPSTVVDLSDPNNIKVLRRGRGLTPSWQNAKIGQI